MRGKDIQTDVVYAVVKSRSQGCEKHAVRAASLGPTPEGTWRVRFEEPMIVGYWSFEPAAKQQSTYRDPDYPNPVTEIDLDSRQFLAPWEDNLAFLERQEREETAQRERLGQDEELVRAALGELKRTLAAKGLELPQDATSVGHRAVEKQSFRVGQLHLQAPEAEALCAILSGRRRKRQAAEASLYTLAQELKQHVDRLGYGEDERLQVAPGYTWHQGRYSHCLQAYLPPEVIGALSRSISGEESSPRALADLLTPLIG